MNKKAVAGAGPCRWEADYDGGEADCDIEKKDGESQVSGRKGRKIVCCFLLVGLLGLLGCGGPAAGPREAGAEETGKRESVLEDFVDGTGGSGAVSEGFYGNPGDQGTVPEGFDGSTGEQGHISESGGAGGQESASENPGTGEKESGGLVYKGSMDLRYAENFAVDYYEGGYTMLSVKDGTRILVIPEDGEAPAGLEEDVILLQRPVEKLYLVASAVMDMFDALGAVDTVTLSGQKEDGWYIDAAKKAMAEGHMLYAGKYNQPDYERIVSEGCTLAIENMMISHSPEVIEMLEGFGIPVMIEYSSYESHPLGRVEWIRFFGALLGKEEEAKEIFERQTKVLEEVASQEQTDKTVAFFYITSNGLVQVRQSSDYVPKMIELAGGRYIFDQLGDPDSARSTLNMQAEEFYNGAKDVDFIIYNSSIDGGVASVEELLDKCALLEDFKAVQEGNVWCTTNDMYQQSMSIGYLIEDMHKMLAGEGEEDMIFLFRLE